VDGLVPWYDGYHGETVRKGPHSYKLRGMAEYFEPEKKTQSGIIAITEVGPTIRSDSLREVWKERWGPAEVKDSKRKKAPENHQFLKDEQVYNTGVKVHIELTVDQEKLRAACGVTNVKKPITLEKLERVLGISETVSTTNMHLFDASMTMRRFATPEAMMEHYFRQRLYQYGRRKDHQVADLKARLEEVANRARYCTMVHDGSLSVVRKTVAQRVEDLAAAGFVKLVPRRGVGAANEGEGEGEGEGEVPRERKDGEEAAAEGASADGAASGGTTKVAQASYDYLLRVPTLQCTTEFSARLRGEEQKMCDELAVLEATRPVRVHPAAPRARSILLLAQHARRSLLESPWGRGRWTCGGGTWRSWRARCPSSGRGGWRRWTRTSRCTRPSAATRRRSSRRSGPSQRNPPTTTRPPACPFARLARRHPASSRCAPLG
jgi:hypothetical protein